MEAGNGFRSAGAGEVALWIRVLAIQAQGPGFESLPPTYEIHRAILPAILGLWRGGGRRFAKAWRLPAYL